MAVLGARHLQAGDRGHKIILSAGHLSECYRVSVLQGPRILQAEGHQRVGRAEQSRAEPNQASRDAPAHLRKPAAVRGRACPALPHSAATNAGPGLAGHSRCYPWPPAGLGVRPGSSPS